MGKVIQDDFSALQMLRKRVDEVQRAPLFVKLEAADRALASFLTWAEGIEGELRELREWREKSERSGVSAAESESR